MRRNKDGGASAGGGDWSTTGTFLRKPPTGWLHEDSQLMHGAFIDYEVYYLGCIEVKQSMRTLQFNVRTQVTKEAILRLAEAAQKVFMGQKKRKVPKQITKILGDVDARITGDMNLSVSVEALKINNLNGGEVMNHSLPSISFASGGDGPTVDFIGYVAKDPVHNRACHVFECPNSSQYVLATIGQAFELRYKIYLQGPRSNSQVPPLSDSAGSNSEMWSTQGNSRSEEVVTTPPAPPTPPPTYEGLEGNGGIYSDVPDLPTTVPPPIPVSRNSSGLNHFPPDIETVSCSPAKPGGVAMGGVTRLENPYDTMPTDAHLPSHETHVYSDPSDQTRVYSDPSDQARVYSDPSDGAHMYSDPGEVTSTLPLSTPSTDDYEYAPRPLVSIRQSTAITSNDPDQIDLTPSHLTHDYFNVGTNGEINQETKPHPPKPPRPPVPSAKPTVKGPSGPKPSPPAHPTRPHRPTHPKPQVRPKPPTVRQAPPTSALVSAGADLYDDPDELGKGEIISSRPTRPGTYDDVVEVLGGLAVGRVANDDNVYDDVAPEEEDTGRLTPLASPKFDDTIYQTAGNGPPKGTSVDPLAPLPRQLYFHGPISRVEAEALLVRDGEFLVRESTKKQGQYVLTGMAGGKIQHLLLMDRHGKVKSRDREFDSIPDLVRHFREKQSALIIGESQVHLTTPVINAFLS